MRKYPEQYPSDMRMFRYIVDANSTDGFTTTFAKSHGYQTIEQGVKYIKEVGVDSPLKNPLSGTEANALEAIMKPAAKALSHEAENAAKNLEKNCGTGQSIIRTAYAADAPIAASSGGFGCAVSQMLSPKLHQFATWMGTRGHLMPIRELAVLIIIPPLHFSFPDIDWTAGLHSMTSVIDPITMTTVADFVVHNDQLVARVITGAFLVSDLLHLPGDILTSFLWRSVTHTTLFSETTLAQLEGKGYTLARATDISVVTLQGKKELPVFEATTKQGKMLRFVPVRRLWNVLDQWSGVDLPPDLIIAPVTDAVISPLTPVGHLLLRAATSKTMAFLIINGLAQAAGNALGGQISPWFVAPAAVAQSAVSNVLSTIIQVPIRVGYVTYRVGQFAIGVVQGRLTANSLTITQVREVFTDILNAIQNIFKKGQGIVEKAKDEGCFSYNPLVERVYAAEGQGECPIQYRSFWSTVRHGRQNKNLAQEFKNWNAVQPKTFINLLKQYTPVAKWYVDIKKIVKKLPLQYRRFIFTDAEIFAQESATYDPAGFGAKQLYERLSHIHVSEGDMALRIWNVAATRNKALNISYQDTVQLITDFTALGKQTAFGPQRLRTSASALLSKHKKAAVLLDAYIQKKYGPASRIRIRLGNKKRADDLQLVIREALSTLQSEAYIRSVLTDAKALDGDYSTNKDQLRNLIEMGDKMKLIQDGRSEYLLAESQQRAFVGMVGREYVDLIGEEDIQRLLYALEFPNIFPKEYVSKTLSLYVRDETIGQTGLWKFLPAPRITKYLAERVKVRLRKQLARSLVKATKKARIAALTPFARVLRTTTMVASFVITSQFAWTQTGNLTYNALSNGAIVQQAVNTIAYVYQPEQTPLFTQNDLQINASYRPLNTIISSAIVRYESLSGKPATYERIDGYLDKQEVKTIIENSDNLQMLLKNPFGLLNRLSSYTQDYQSNDALWQEAFQNNQEIYPIIYQARKGNDSINDFGNPRLPSGLGVQVSKYLAANPKSDAGPVITAYFGDIAAYVETMYSKNHTPVSTEDILVYLLIKNDGRLDRALWDEALFLKYAARNMNPAGTVMQQYTDKNELTTWIGTYVLDEFSYDSPSYQDVFRVSSKDNWNCSPGCNKSEDPINLFGEPYHAFFGAALLNALNESAVQGSYTALQLMSRQEQGKNKLASDFQSASTYTEVEKILESKMDSAPKEPSSGPMYVTDWVVGPDEDVFMYVLQEYPSDLTVFLNGEKLLQLPDGRYVGVVEKTFNGNIQSRIMIVIPKEAVSMWGDIKLYGIGDYVIDGIHMSSRFVRGETALYANNGARVSANWDRLVRLFPDIVSRVYNFSQNETLVNDSNLMRALMTKANDDNEKSVKIVRIMPDSEVLSYIRSLNAPYPSEDWIRQAGGGQDFVTVYDPNSGVLDFVYSDMLSKLIMLPDGQIIAFFFVDDDKNITLLPRDRTHDIAAVQFTSIEALASWQESFDVLNTLSMPIGKIDDTWAVETIENGITKTQRLTVDPSVLKEFYTIDSVKLNATHMLLKYHALNGETETYIVTDPNIMLFIDTFGYSNGVGKLVYDAYYGIKPAALNAYGDITKEQTKQFLHTIGIDLWNDSVDSRWIVAETNNSVPTGRYFQVLVYLPRNGMYNTQIGLLDLPTIKLILESDSDIKDHFMASNIIDFPTLLEIYPELDPSK